MTDITRLGPQDIFVDDEALSEYRDRYRVFFDELVKLNTNIYIVEAILKFPFYLFAGDAVFFTMVVRNFLDAATLIIAKLARDNNEDFLSLTQFKNQILIKYVKPEYQGAFRELLKEVKFGSKANKLLDTVMKIRHRRVAHLTALDHQAATLTLSDLKDLCEKLNTLFEALSFNSQPILLPFQYYPGVIRPEGSNHKPDIEELLDHIARESILLNMPEKEPDSWHHQHKIMTEHQLSQLNEYRRKFGLTEV